MNDAVPRNYGMPSPSGGSGPEAYPDEPLASLVRRRVRCPAGSEVSPYYAYPRIDNVAPAYTVYEDRTLAVRVFGRTYCICDRISGRVVEVLFPEQISGPLGVDNIAESAFLVEVWRVESAPFRYVAFFLYPHRPLVHIWLVDESGVRKQGVDLSPNCARRFLAQRASANLMFAYRLLLSSRDSSAGGESAPPAPDGADFEASGLGGVSYEAFFSTNNIDDHGENAAFAGLLDRMRGGDTSTQAIQELVQRHASELRHAEKSAYAMVDERTRLISSIVPDGAFSGRPDTITPDPEHLVCRLGRGLTGLDLLRAAAAARLPRVTLPDSRKSMIERAMREVSIRSMTAEEHAEAQKRDTEAVLVTVRTRPSVRLDVAVPRFLADFDRFREMFGRHGADPFGPLPRLYMLLVPLADMLLSHFERFCATVREECGGLPDALRFFASWGDVALTDGVVSYGRRKGANNPLLPDVYFYGSDAYWHWKRLNISGDQTWSRRISRAVWRGTTTGQAFSAQDLQANQRVQLVYLCKQHPELFDAKVVRVAQVAKDEAARIMLRLEQDGVFASAMSPERYRDYQFSIDIDGNANAWGFFEKLALGLCVLKVETPYDQWFYPEVKPWVHYVPVSGDLRDLVSRAQELQADVRLAERIAAAGAAFAVERDVTSEAVKFCNALARGIGTGNLEAA